MTDVSSEPVPVDAAHFPDENFREAVRNRFDADEDGALSAAEIAEATYFYAPGWDIVSVKGIEYLTAFDDVRLFSNMIRVFDASHNPAISHLGLFDNPLEVLIARNNPKLVDIVADDCSLVALDVSGCPALEELTVGHKLAEIDVSHNPRLRELEVDHNCLTHLDVSHNPCLEMISAFDNQLAEIDVSHNPKLEIVCVDKDTRIVGAGKNVKISRAHY